MRISFAAIALALVVPAFTVPALAQPAPAPAQASQLPPDPLHRDWHAFWITHPTAPLREPLVLRFRRALTLYAVPPSYIVRVSADNRFILYVNGQRVGDGPARGDLDHWRYERFDLAPFLHTGQNLVAATVWNWGVYAPVAQFTNRTAFLLESEATGADSISTPQGWRVEEDPGRTPLPRSTLTYTAYYASGPGEKVDAAQTDWNWDSATSTGQWLRPGNPMRESPYPGTNRARSADTTEENPWGLLPNTLPHQQYTPINPGHIVSLDTIAAEQPGLSTFPASPATFPPHCHVHILLDRNTLTTAYPALTVSGGKGSAIWLTYSEALFDDHFHKADRNALTYTDAKDIVHQRRALGLRDEFLPDGGSHRTFQPL
ncbi:MAG TPA: hypothetical protein VGR64_04780, partial [Terracidiphilus sp.]|nr:hypothetical protein [Terracidiphilus sp.]